MNIMCEDIWLRLNAGTSRCFVTVAHGVIGFGLIAPALDGGLSLATDSKELDTRMQAGAFWWQLLWVKESGSPTDPHLYPETAWPLG